MEHEELKRSVEALLFAASDPLSIEKLKSVLGVGRSKEIEEAIAFLKEEYDREGRSFQLISVAEGYQLYTKPEYADLVKELFKGRKRPKLSPQALETVAIIAYRQPVTRLEVERIRGVSSEGVVATLLERDLIRPVGRESAVGRPILYGTTREFLRYFQLKDLSELPERGIAKGAEGTAEGAESTEENAKGAEKECGGAGVLGSRGEAETQGGGGDEGGERPPDAPKGTAEDAEIAEENAKGAKITAEATEEGVEEGTT